MRSICIFSFINVENVVNPPQKPTVRNNFNPCGIHSCDKPQNRPISKQPSTLTANVPAGIHPSNQFCTVRVRR